MQEDDGDERYFTHPTQTPKSEGRYVTYVG